MKNGETGTGAGSSLGRLARTFKNYVLQLHLLARELFRDFAADTTRILVASGASLVCQSVALLALFSYLRALEHGAPLLGLPSRESPLLFTLVGAATALLLVGYAVLEYRANIAILSLCRRFQNRDTAEALALCSALPHWFAESDSTHISSRHLRQILSIDVNHRSRLARLFLLSIIPAARLLLCTLALIYLNPQFSAVIVLAVGIPVLGLYFVGRKVADTVTIRESGTEPVFPRQRHLLQESWQRHTPLEQTHITWETALGEPDSRYRQYFRRLRAKAQGGLLINTANTVGILVLVIALGLWVLWKQQGNWSLWVTYLVVLRYFLASMRSVAQLLVRSTRFLRQAQRFADFVAAARVAVRAPDPAVVPCPEQVAAAFKGKGGKSDNADDEDDDLDDD